MNDNEILWKDVEGYEMKYSISNTGLVKSYYTYRTLKPRKNNKGYLVVQLCGKRKKKYAVVHRLVAIAFIDNPNNYSHVNHVDCDKTNNRVENLEWCTPEQNAEHAQKHGLMQGVRGVEHWSYRKHLRKS